MQQSLPEFVHMLLERNLYNEEMRVEVLAIDMYDMKAIATLESKSTFTMKWCRRHCILLLIAHFQWKLLFGYILPYCLGFKKMKLFNVDSSFGKRLHVIRAIK